MKFRDRIDAANQLAKALDAYRGDDNVVVLGVPRGAMPMAKAVSEHLGAPLGAVLAHKIGAPGNKEFAIGCVGLSGHIYRSPYALYHGVSEDYIQDQAEKELETLKKRKRAYGLKDEDLEDKTVIIVDDGIATGATTLCAVHEVKSRNPRRVVLACAVSSRDALRKLEDAADEVVVLAAPAYFFSVGQFFEEFGQVSDEDVVKILRGRADGKQKAA